MIEKRNKRQLLLRPGTIDGWTTANQAKGAVYPGILYTLILSYVITVRLQWLAVVAKGTTKYLIGS